MFGRKKPQQSKDQPIATDFFEHEKAVKALHNLSVEDLGHNIPTEALLEATRISIAFDKAKEAKKIGFQKRVAKPLKRVKEAIENVETIKQNITKALDSQLLDLGIEYENSVNEYEEAYHQLKRVNPQAQNRCYDHLPSDPSLRLTWLAGRRRLWNK